MLLSRIITGIIGALATVGAVGAGGWIFFSAVAFLALLAWHEYCKAFQHMKMNPGYSFGLLFMPVVIGCAWQGNSEELLGVVMLGAIMVFCKTVFQYQHFAVQDAAITLSGMVYIGLAFAHFVLLRFTDNQVFFQTEFGVFSAGEALIWIAFLGTWASDTFAYFSGRLLGRHKLCPEISPKKTVEGFVGGVAGTAMITVLLGLFFQFSLVHMLFLGILIAGTATVGDLVESSMKRLTGIKDSGNILPGHGGIWDRFDSMLFTVPLVYYYTQLFSLY